MDLKSLAAAAGVVKTSNGTEIPVRGLALSDIGQIIQDHKDQLERAFNTLKQVEGEDDLQTSNLLQDMLHEAPRLAGAIIVKATDSDNSIEDALRLPAGLQLAILEEAGRQTFVTEGGLGKTLEIVINMINSTTQTLVGLNSPKL